MKGAPATTDAGASIVAGVSTSAAGGVTAFGVSGAAVDGVAAGVLAVWTVFGAAGLLVSTATGTVAGREWSATGCEADGTAADC